MESALTHAIKREAEPRVRASMVIGLTRLWQGAAAREELAFDPARAANFLTGLMATGVPAVIRLTAALGAVALGLDALRPAAQTALLESAANGLTNFPEPPWHRYTAMRDVSLALAGQPTSRRRLLAALLRHADANLRHAALYVADEVCQQSAAQRRSSPRASATCWATPARG